MSKDFFYGITLFFIVYVLINFVSGLLSVLTCALSLNIYSILIGELLLYLAILYFVFYRIKKFPEIKPWFVVVLFIIYFIPKNFFYIYSTTELQNLAKIFEYEKTIRALFIAAFSLIAYIKYYRIKER